jgi:DNA-binding GntR family transcriptional regulator
VVVQRMSRSEEVERALLERLETLADADGRLPTEADMAEMFGVSRGTVRAAVGALATRGLVTRRQGMGTFLKKLPHLHNPIDEAIDFCEVIARNGRQPGRRYLKAAIETPKPAIAEALQAPGQPALIRHTVFTADDDPVIYCINTFPLTAVPLPLAERVVADPALSEPLYDFMERECAVRIEYHRSTIWPALAADCDLLELVCHPLAPVIAIDEVGYTGTGRPVVHSLEVYPDAFMRFEMIRRRGLRP